MPESLPGANLTNSYLNSANLTNTKLKNANLSYTKIIFSNLVGADLTNANFAGADLYGAKVDREEILQTNIKGAVLLGIDSLQPEDIDTLLQRGATVDSGNKVLVQYDNIFVSLEVGEEETDQSEPEVNFTLTVTKENNLESITIPLRFGTDFAPYPGQRLPVRIVDLDGDKIPEIIVDYFSGGAHCCLASQIFRFPSFDSQDLTYSWTKHDWLHTGYHLRLNLKTGLPEFFSYDNDFAYRFSSFAASHFPLQTWQYDQGKMIDTTRQHPELLRKQSDDGRS